MVWGEDGAFVQAFVPKVNCLERLKVTDVDARVTNRTFFLGHHIRVQQL